MNNLLLFESEPGTVSPEPASLAEKYKPIRFDDFIGLEKPKQLMRSFANRPFGCAWLFVGRSGTGKSTMAEALALSISAEVHRLPAHECTRENVSRVWAQCQTSPLRGCKRHLILVEQADQLRLQHQYDLRSKLEGGNLASGIIWIFTAASASLEMGLRSRCLNVKFSSQGISKEAALFLEEIWNAEIPASGHPKPNFTRIVKEARNDIRSALRELELKIAALS